MKVIKILFAAFTVLTVISVSGCCGTCGWNDYNYAECEEFNEGTLRIVNPLPVPAFGVIQWDFTEVENPIKVEENFGMISRIVPVNTGNIKLEVEGYTFKDEFYTVVVNQCRATEYQILIVNDSVLNLSAGSITVY